MSAIPGNLRPATLTEAHEVIEQLRQLIATLQTRVAALEEQVRQTSQNSSRPPSVDPPAVTRPAKRRRSGRRPGAQPGHAAQVRAVVPPEQVDHVVPVRPPVCRGCGAALRGSDPGPRRHQVTELPPIRPVVRG